MDVDLESSYRSRRPSKNPVVVIGGGQSGLAAAFVLHELEVATLVLEAGDRPAGSWRQYCDSLRLFSPAGFSSMAGMRFPGDPDHYPARDEVAEYLDRYAETISVEIQTRTRVVSVRREGREFVIGTSMDAGFELLGSSPRAARSLTLTGRSSLARRDSPANWCTSPSTATQRLSRACG